MTTVVASGDAAALVDVDLRTRQSWMLTYPQIPIYVHDIWLDVVHRKGMEQWRIVSVATPSTENVYVIVGKLTLQALTARVSVSRRDADVNPNDLDNSSAWTAVICHTDLSPFDMRGVAHLRSQLAHQTAAPPPRHVVLAVTTQSPPSTSYYTLQDCLVV